MPTIRFTRDTRAAESEVMRYEGDTLEVTPESAQRWLKRGAAVVMEQAASRSGEDREAELRAQGVRVLRQMARAWGISVSGVSKEQLVQALKAAEAAQPIEKGKENAEDGNPALDALLQEPEETLRDQAAELGIEGADALGREDLAAAVRDARRRFGDEPDGPDAA